MKPDPDIILFLEVWQDEFASPETRDRLLRRMETDAAFVSEVAEQIAMLGALRASQFPEPRWLELRDLLEAEAPASPTEDSFEAAVMKQIVRRPGFGARIIRLLPALAAVIVLTLLGLGWMWFGPQKYGSPIPATAELDHHDQPAAPAIVGYVIKQVVGHDKAASPGPAA